MTVVAPATVAAPTTDDDLALFLSQRRRLVGLAHRVIRGDVADAEDVVQEVWLRWQRTDRSVVRNPEAFLTATTTRLAINVVQAARRRHEAPSATLEVLAAGPASADPAYDVGLAADVVEAMGTLLARLSARELAALVLREGFAYPYPALARLLRTSVVNARQLVRRAAARLPDGPRRAAVEPAARRRLADAFLASARTGDLEPLERLLVS